MCLFCKIAKKEQPAEFVYEDKNFVCFKDINPKAATHLLIIPREHIESINHLLPKHSKLAGDLLLTAQKIAKKIGVADFGYKLTFHVGRGGGQIIDHLHLHLLSDKKSEGVS